MIINATSHIMKNIWKFFLVIFLFITLSLVVLKNGIRIENLDLPNFKIKQLYIKLDKKLIVNIHTIDINMQNNQKTSLSEIQFYTDKSYILNPLFKTISIQNLILGKDTVHFLFKDDIFYVDSPYLTIDAKLFSSKNTIEFKINQMVLKDYEIEFKGMLHLNTKKTLHNFRGTFHTFNINGNIELRLDNDILYYRLATKKFSTLKPFMDYLTPKIKLEPLISQWIYQKIVANEYILHNLEGQFNIKTNEFFPKLMKGKASAKNASVTFDKNAPAAIISDLSVELKDDTLIFHIIKANYEGKDVTKTKVHIYNLMSKGAGIVVDIKANTILDESIHKVLKAFHINVPITQTSGKTKSNVILDIKFLPFEVKSYTASFDIDNSNFNLAGLPIYSKKGTIKIDNNDVYITNTNLKYKSLFNLNTTGKFDIKNGLYKSKNYIKSLHIDFDNKELLHIKDVNISSTLKLNKNTIISLDELNSTLSFAHNSNEINIDNLSSIYKYSKLMQKVKLHNGKLKIKTNDFNHFNILANLKNIQLPLQKNGKTIKNLDLSIDLNGTQFQAHSLNRNIQIDNKDGLNIFIQDLDTTFDSSDLNSTSDFDKVSVIGIHSNIIDTNSSLIIPSNSFTFQTDGPKMTFENHLFNQQILIKKDEKSLFLNSDNLSAEYLNSLLAKDVFKDGTFKLNLKGIDSDYFNGTLVAKDTTIVGMSFYNNLMAFLHTIPSLLSLKNPGFNEEGYNINDAIVNFTKIKNILTINNININGKSADITGKGTIDIKTKKIDIVLQISVLKSLSSVVNNIPVLNYIILGKDGKLYTTVKVTGNFDKPIITTNVMSDTVLSPYGIIKRVIQSPFKSIQ